MKSVFLSFNLTKKLDDGFKMLFSKSRNLLLMIKEINKFEEFEIQGCH